MRRQIELTEGVRRDVEEALDWTLEHFGEIQRRRYQTLIRKSIKELQSPANDYRLRPRPDLHPDARVYHIARPGIRASHYFVVRMYPGDLFVIGCLLHDARDLPRQLPKDFEA